MNNKSLMMLGLLAAAPMASQAAMVEMDDASLSEVQGQSFHFGFNLQPAMNYTFDNTATYISTSANVGIGPKVTAGHTVDGDPTRSWSFGFEQPMYKGFSYTRNK